MAEGIDDASYAPVVFVVHGIDLRRSGGEGTSKDGIGIGDGENDANGTSVESLGTEVEMLGRFIAEPKLGTLDGEAGDDATTVLEEKDFGCSEGRLVEIDGAGTVANAEPGFNGGLESGGIGHGGPPEVREVEHFRG